MAPEILRRSHAAILNRYVTQGSSAMNQVMNLQLAREREARRVPHGVRRRSLQVALAGRRRERRRLES